MEDSGMMTLEQMKEELKRKYERLRKREEARRKLMLKYYEPIETPPLFPPLKRRKTSNPNDLEFLIGEKGETGLERLMNRIRILAEYGKDPEAEKLATKLGIAFMLMSPRDFWTYLYDWAQEAIALLEKRKIMVPPAVYAWARRVP